MSDTLKLVYPGLDERTRKGQMSLVENVEDDDPKFYPRPASNVHYYYPKRKDSFKELKVKAARRKRYRELRKKEVEEGIADMDAVREVCGIVFEKGVPVEVSKQKVLESSEGEAIWSKLLSWVKQGLLVEALEEKKPEPSPEPEPESKPDVGPVQKKPAPSKFGGKK